MCNGMVALHTRAPSSSSSSSLAHRLAFPSLLLLITVLPHGRASGKAHTHLHTHTHAYCLLASAHGINCRFNLVAQTRGSYILIVLQAGQIKLASFYPRAAQVAVLLFVAFMNHNSPLSH